MTPGPNVAPRSETDTPEAELLSAQALVDLIAYAGPGSRLKVRSHRLSDETTKIGFTTWLSDYTKGPALYYYDPRDEASIDSILPLGGHTVFMTPPKINTPGGSGRALPIILGGGFENSARVMPIDPIAERDYRFELLPSEKLTQQEISAIHASEMPDKT
jgi:hypothetical protein